MPTDLEEVKSFILSKMNSIGTDNARRLKRELFPGQPVTSFLKAVETVAATNVHADFLRVGQPIDVYSVRLVPGASLTGDNTDYATVGLTYDNGGGGSRTNVAVKSTTLTASGTGNWASDVVLDLTPTAPVRVPAGSLLAYSTYKAGNGINVVASYLVVEYENVGTDG